jgi:carbonic anhydrase/acetyltransferase-like protein (isoleucine patch superfamily)
MEGSVVDAMTVLQPGTVVPPAKYIPSGEVWGGSPARFIRKLTHDEVCIHLQCLGLAATACLLGNQHSACENTTCIVCLSASPSG